MTLLTDSLVTDLGYGLINEHGQASLAYVFDKMNIGD